MPTIFAVGKNDSTSGSIELNQIAIICAYFNKKYLMTPKIHSFQQNARKSFARVHQRVHHEEKKKYRVRTRHHQTKFTHD